ncbi:MAG TPA: hypothetical protein VD866_31270 [Urbifossiella sp.]|nr:hypothetical protein [Urbifossiella sp.]
MPQARITQVRDALAAFIDAAWDEAVVAEALPARATADEVIAKYRLDFSLDSSKPLTFEGRKVCVFVGTYQGIPADRGEGANDYTLTVWVLELYRDPAALPGAPQGAPPDEWLDERLYFAEWLWKRAGNPRTVELLGSLWPQEVGEVVALDPDRLAEQKLFISQFTITFREHAAP